MLRLLADENFNGDMFRGLIFRQPDIDIVRTQDVGLSGEDDRAILIWAADNNRVIVTHDRATMPDDAYDRIADGMPMPGVFVISDRMPVGAAIDEILLLNQCSSSTDWNGRVIYLPL